ncbi:Uncharacterised protein [Metamycoplasma cloacale]|uniref:Uncharacterized protein n=1 Tax=Metamycoplasma cloacale TaxID=92401 RepID=A0A2Z4LLE7_9BACT|nr:hypothetical protein [Metamycoplasma cloacale]AWX42533.1 hypothetical protein DK849_00315 [Metamycoplasma cloacale]VEU79121.1 Uncharacterised protein [Metamycoplasma cloacale]VEU79806.1 Uncharacterised protein [Metamycoplasma cloacale]
MHNSLSITLCTLFLIIFVVVIITIVISFIKLHSKKNNDNYGFVIFDIDLRKQRAKWFNDINMLNKAPEFMKKSPLVSGEWCEMSDFYQLFNNNSIAKIKRIWDLKKYLTEIEKLKVSLTTGNNELFEYTITVEIPNNNSNIIQVSLEWQKQQTKNTSIFNRITEHINSLFQQKYHSVLCAIINSKYILDEETINGLYNQLIPTQIATHMDLIKENDRLFFAFKGLPHVKKNTMNIYNEILENFSNKAVKYFDYVFVVKQNSNNKLLPKTYNTLLNYIYLLIETKKLDNFQIIEENLTNKDDYKFFSKAYNRAEKLINNNELTMTYTNVKNLSKNSNDYKIINPVLTNRSLDDILRVQMNDLDVFSNLTTKFIETNQMTNRSNSIFILDDYYFVKNGLNPLRNMIENNDNLYLTIRISNWNNIINVINKYELLKTDYPMNLYIDNIDNNVVQILNEKNIKMIILGKNITNNLNIPKNMIYTNKLIELIRHKRGIVVFDNFNANVYKKIFEDKYEKIYYTE